jgi:CRISPR-associated protein Csm4
LKVYEITIKPTTGFGTPIKGDTVFGHFCWQIFYDEKLIGNTLDAVLSNYKTNPFVIFSSAFPKFCVGKRYLYAFKIPNLPLDKLFDLPEDKKERVNKRKEYKSKQWMMIEEGHEFSSFKKLKYLSHSELFEEAKTNLSEETRKKMRRAGAKNYIAVFSQPRNSINRLTFTTGKEGFAPFEVEQYVFHPETELALFVGIDEAVVNISQILEGLERTGKLGFGKDASTGLGRFDLGEETEIDLKEVGSKSPNACYTLAPCVPEKETFVEMFFTPFTRFGRHGDVLAKSSNPFKNPVIMADEGGIFIPKSHESFNKPYIGRAVMNISKAEPRTVMQGYSLYLPVNVEV